MENFDFGTLAAALVPVVAGLLGVGFVYVRKIVKASENKIDDAILEAIDEAYAKGYEAKEAELDEDKA